MNSTTRSSHIAGLVPDRLKSMTIRAKLLVFPLLFVVAIPAVQGLNLWFQRKMSAELTQNIGDQMKEGHRRALHAAVEIEAGRINALLSKMTTREEKIAAIIAETDPIRFFADRSGYFFAYDLKGTRINVPTNKSSNGKNFMGLVDKNGVHFIAEMVKAAKAGGGYVSYVFEKEGKGVQPKESYVLPIAGSDMFIGAGVYTDDIAEEQSRVTAMVDARNRKLIMILLAVCGGITAVVILASAGVSRSINRSISSVIENLEASSNELKAASQQVSTSSQTLADGSSQQAAALEETSASLEEISSMTKKNAESATEAKSLANQTRIAADGGSASMVEMEKAMAGIKESSQRIGKIVKAIDEIAFQTNILALNAAVEAARAGEAGAGFAVVAEEVRNLAQRSAQSAKETASSIEDALQRSNNGVQISERVSLSFREIVEKARQVDELVGEIARASIEQSQGVGQVTVAVSQMDKVTQSNAAGAEESAAASEELTAQAEVMRESIHDLQTLVGGTPRLSHQTREMGSSASPPKRGPTTNRLLSPKLVAREECFVDAT